MKRISILFIALLAFVASACAGEGASSSSPSEPAATQEPTPEPTESPSLEASASESSSGSEGALADLIPDEVAGLSRTDIPGMESIIGSALAGSGVDASGAEYAFASYGEGERTVILTALRIPEMDEASLQVLAQAMAGADASGEVSAEPTTVGGKSVLQMTGAGSPTAAYLYFASGAVFTVVSEDAELAGQLLAELP